MLENNRKITISKYLLFSVFVICLIFTSFGFNIEDSYAVDVNESSDEMEIELDTQDKLENSQENELLGVSIDEDEILAAERTVRGNTFADIQNEINDANPGDVIILSGTYYSGGKYNPILVDKKLTITSTSGATLDGEESSMIIWIFSGGSDTVISNLKFVRGADEWGSAIRVGAKDVTIEWCNFENNHCSLGGAVVTEYNLYDAESLLIRDCNFTKNAGYYKNYENHSSAGAVGAFAMNSQVVRCIFDGNYVIGKNDAFGGAIQMGLDVAGYYGRVLNCTFKNNYALHIGGVSHGGAGCVRNGVDYVRCVFINNTAGQGGALTFHASGNIVDCVFINNTATKYGGALSTGFLYNTMNLQIKRCTFEGNKAPEGGAVQAIGLNVEIFNSDFNNNYANTYGGAVYVQASEVSIDRSNFNNNSVDVDGGAIYIKGVNTLIKESKFNSNYANPHESKLNDGLGGAIYINSTKAELKSNVFRYNTARNGSAIYYDNAGENLTIYRDSFVKNQAWVYWLPISTEDIYYGDREGIKVVIYGGNNIADYDNLAISNAIYNAADNHEITINGQNPVNGATDSGHLYQDSREYNIDVLLTVQHEDGTLIFNNTLKSSYLGEIGLELDNLKPGKYNVMAQHFEDTYYKGITNVTSFNVYPKVDNEIKISSDKFVYDFEDVVVWTINITNYGPNNATNVTVGELIPDGLIYFSDTSEGLYNSATGILNVSTLDVGEKRSFNIVTIVNKTGKITNKVNITSKELDINLNNNADEQTIKVNPACDIVVLKTVDNSNPDYLDKVTWTIVVRNNGPDVAHNVTVRDVLPDSLIPVDFDSRELSWKVDSLGVNKEVSFKVVTVVAAQGLIENDVSANASEFDYDLSNNNDSEIIRVKPAADLSIVKLVNASAVNYHDVVKWTLVVKNNGPDKATGVNVTDILPNGFIYLDSSLDYLDGVISVGDLAVGEERSIDLICYVNVTGNFTNFASVRGNEHDHNLSNNKANRSITVNLACDISVLKTVDNANPDYLDKVTWTIVVRNNGPDVAHNVTVRDVLPTSLIPVDFDSQELSWKVDSLGVNKEVSFKFVTVVNGGGFIENSASANASEFDYDLSNNDDSEIIEVKSDADLSIVKLVNASAVNYHDIVKWTLVVKNNGPDKATGVNVTDILPDGFIYIDSSLPYINNIMSVGELAVGEERSIDLICYVNVTGNFTNFANVRGNEHDHNLSNNKANKSIVVNPASDISVLKTADNSNPNYLDKITWTIVVRNNGPDVAHNISVTDNLPESLIPVDFDSNELSWNIESLGVNKELSFKFVTVVGANGLIENNVSAYASEFDYDLSNNGDNEIINVNPAADLSIVKLANASAVNYHDIVKWTLVVKNNGPDKATGVNVTDVLPEGFICIGSSLPYINNIINIGDLAVGEERSVDLICYVNVTGNFTNFASVRVNEHDHNLSNNPANRSITVNPAADLEIIKTANQSELRNGELVKWTIIIKNNGPDIAHEIKVSDELSNSLIWFDDDSSGKYNLTTGILSIDMLDVGKEFEFNMICQVNETGLIVNGVNVTAREFDFNLTNNQDYEMITAKPTADVSITKLVNNTAPKYNDLVKWTITVSNNGPDKATGVEVNENMPEGLILIKSNPTKGTYDNGIWNVCCLEKGEVETLEIICRVNKIGRLTNHVSIKANEFDPDYTNNNAEESIDVPPAVDIEVINKASNPNPLFGETIVWMITVKNNGPDDATEVELMDSLPESLIYLDYESTKGNYVDGLWKLGKLNVGETEYLNITCIANDLGKTVNNAYASSFEYDWNESNNYDDAEINVLPVADLAIEKLVDNTNPHQGDTITWILRVSNNGPNDASNVWVLDNIPKEVEIIKTSDDKNFKNGKWYVGDLRKGEVKEISIQCRVIASGLIKNSANVWGDVNDPDLTNNKAEKSVSVPPVSDLSITKIASKYKYAVGDVIEYVIEVVNNGPDTAYNIKVTEILDDLLKLKSFKVSKGKYNKFSNVWTIDKLRYGESAKLIIKVIAASSGIIKNTVLVSSDTYDSDLSNNNDFAIVKVSEKSPNNNSNTKNTNSNTPKSNSNGNMPSSLEMHPTTQPFLMLVVSLLFSMVSFGVGNISKKR